MEIQTSQKQNIVQSLHDTLIAYKSKLEQSAQTSPKCTELLPVDLTCLPIGSPQWKNAMLFKEFSEEDKYLKHLEEIGFSPEPVSYPSTSPTPCPDEKLPTWKRRIDTIDPTYTEIND